MNWTLHRWIWQLDAPLYVGAPPAGSLNRARFYVPARALWGAVAAELARRENTTSAAPSYEAVGAEIRQQARFTYLYPAEHADGGWRAWLPEYREGDGLVWVREGRTVPIVDRRFRRRLLWTRPGTAIDPESDSVVDGSLRETECVQTRWRDDSGSEAGRVSLVGYALIRNGAGLANRLLPVDTLFVGGDTRYGLGRLKRAEMMPARNLFDVALDVGVDKPQVVARRVLAHSVANDKMTPLLRGDQEALAGWDATSLQPQQRLSGPAWKPGSTSADPMTWTLLGTGMWVANGTGE